MHTLNVYECYSFELFAADEYIEECCMRPFSHIFNMADANRSNNISPHVSRTTTM